MAALTPITGTHALARIIPFPSPELEKLPPASPLPITQEDERANEMTDGEESQASQVMRYTPRDPPSITEEDPTAAQAQVDARPTEAEHTGPAPDQPQPVGSYMDLLV
jgi:hypothetical protein